MIMNILTETQHRALSFIAAANLGGYAPTPDEVEDWLVKSEPKRIGGIASLGWAGISESLLYGALESPVHHMESIGWVRAEDGGAKLTDLGRALLRSADTEDDAQGQVVILDHDSPLAYASLIGELSDIGDALLIDPYLELDHLLDLEKHTDITRVLISTKHSTSKRGAQLKLFQEKRSDEGIEIKVADELHDRVIVAEGGRVWTLGMSLNGVSKQKSITVLTPMPAKGAEPLAEWANERWRQASPLVTPEEPEEEITEDETHP